MSAKHYMYGRMTPPGLNLRSRLMEGVRSCPSKGRRLVLFSAIGRCSRRRGAPVRIVVLGESANSLSRALHLKSVLSEGVASGIELSFAWWKFDWLRHPDFLREASEAAVKADIIVVLSSWHKPLPQAIQDCLNRGLVSKCGRSPRFLALLETGNPSRRSSPDIALLRNLGNAANVQVYCSSGFFDVGNGH